MAKTLKKNRVQHHHPSGQNRPTRRCAWTREAAPQDELLRLVLDPSGGVFVDVLGKAPGRGVYIRPTPQVVRAALCPKGWGRLFRGRATHLGLEPSLTEDGAPRALHETIAARVLERATELVALARRAGQLEVGTDTVRQALENIGSGSTLILAEDLGASTARALLEAVEASPYEVRVRCLGDKIGLGERLGRGPTGVLLCRAGPIADRLAAEGRRLAELTGRPDVGPLEQRAQRTRAVDAPAEARLQPSREGAEAPAASHREARASQAAPGVPPVEVEGRVTRYSE